MSYQTQLLRIGGRWVIARSADMHQAKRAKQDLVRFVLLSALALGLTVALEVLLSPTSLRIASHFPWVAGSAETESWELVP